MGIIKKAEISKGLPLSKSFFGASKFFMLFSQLLWSEGSCDRKKGAKRT